ncbi:MAG TPA: HD domain-containing phosphohydrolase [Treponemataceae bacterium]|nr:HD domain-containing phosphohydrolase [Treponemataceae bacterium]HOQ92990.1 HD domain-containing phosphohydrolase [Treponemataceae bacterium]
MIKKSAFIVIFFCSFFFLNAQSSLVERYLAAANTSYSEKDYAKAFSYINYVYGQYDADKTPRNVEVLAELIYYDYLNHMRVTNNFSEFQVVKDRLAEFPAISSDRVTRLVRTLNTLESQNTNLETTVSTVLDLRDAVEYKIQLERTKAELHALEKALEDARESAEKEKLYRDKEFLETQKELYEKALNLSNERDGVNKTFVLLIIIAVVVLFFVLFVVMMIIVRISTKNAKKQQEQFEATLQMVSQIARNPSERLSLGSFVDSFGDAASNGRIGGTQASLPRPELTEEERLELQDLALKCEAVGEDIDRVTGRKNNSKNVAELVYKISHQLSCSTYDSMLYFCAAMVYDAGFLKIDTEIFTKESLSTEEKYEIRSHVKQATESFDFIPEKYLPVFLDAALMHHENMDGSGYPTGARGENIPLIARIIRVVESFISLISRRNYRGIFDKEAAITELKNSSHLYDSAIIDALDTII